MRAKRATSLLALWPLMPWRAPMCSQMAPARRSQTISATSHQLMGFSLRATYIASISSGSTATSGTPGALARNETSSASAPSAPLDCQRPLSHCSSPLGL